MAKLYRTWGELICFCVQLGGVSYSPKWKMADPRNFSPIRAFFLSSYRVNIARCNLCARAKVKGHIKLKIEENTSVVKSKLNLHLYVHNREFLYSCVFIQDILSCFIHICYESCKLLNFRFCHKRLNFIYGTWLAVWSKSNCRLSA